MTLPYSGYTILYKVFCCLPPQIIEYTGDRTLDELIKWVEAHMDGKSDEGEEEEEEEEEGGAEPGHEHTEL